MLLWIYTEFHFSHCTAEIVNISDHKSNDQHNELKKWALENPVPDITDKEKNAIDNFILDVFEVHMPITALLELHNNNNILFYYHKRNVEKTMESIQKKKVDLVQKDAEFIRRILDAW